MNYSIIFKMLSMVLWIMVLAFSVCAGVSFFYSDSTLEAEAMPSWICSIALSALFAFAFYLPSRNAPSKLYKKEAMCIVGLGWILSSLVGAIPYILILNCPFEDAFFESSSGITTTGASVFSSFANFPHSLMFWRCLSHWIGGLGVLVFFVAILSFLGSGGRILYASESSSSGGGLETERIQSGIFHIMSIYMVLSLLCLITFKLCGMDWFDGICHMFSAVSTGGFSVYENSIAHYNSNLINWAVIVFMFLGGTSFTVLILLIKGRFGKILANTEFLAYILVLTIASITISLMVYPQISEHGNLFDAFTHGVFQTVSIMTTTGLFSTGYQNWIPATHILLFIVMLIGGCAGSTSGGIKVSRLVGSGRLTIRSIEKSFRPRVVRNIFLNGKVLDEESADGIMSFIMLFALIALGAFAILAVFEPQLSMTACISGTLSTMCNIGPGFMEVGPDATYGFMMPQSKIFLGILMIMGRLEFYAVLVLFMPSLWKKFQ